MNSVKSYSTHRILEFSIQNFNRQITKTDYQNLPYAIVSKMSEVFQVSQKPNGINMLTFFGQKAFKRS